MKDYPEEFLGIQKGIKWDRILMDARSCLPEDEIAALDEMLKQLTVDRFNEDVLKTLAGEEQPETLKYTTSERYDHSWTDARAFVDPAMQAEQQRQNMRNANLGQNSALQGLGAQGSSGFLSGLFK
jgi:hypothetical protein